MSTIGIGYSSALAANRPPVAVITPAGQEAVVGSIVKLDGRASHDPEGSELTYEWKFVQVPIGSQVEKAGFVDLDSDSSIVSFAPDIIGVYKISLSVYDSDNLVSEPFISQIDTRIILVPYHQGYCPDASFIWNYLSDFWNRVEGKDQIETFWEGAIQIVAAEMLKAFQYDYNKSIKDIQTVIQKRWVHYDPAMALDSDTTTFVLADDVAGIGAESVEVDLSSGLPTVPQPHLTNFIGVPKTAGNLETTGIGIPPLQGRVISFADRAFTLLRVSHSWKSVVHDDDGALTVATQNFSASTGTFTAGMVGYRLYILTGSQVGVSANIVTFNSSSSVTLDGPTWPANESGIEFTVIPKDPTHNAVVVDQVDVPTNLKNKPWRLSATVISTLIDFEENGVSVGDVIEVEIARTDAGLATPFFVQVTGVDRNRIGFVLNLDALLDGTAANGIAQDEQIRMAADLQVPGLFLAPDQSLIYADQAGLIYNTITANKFKRAYYEKVLTPETEIDVGAFKIIVRPVQVIRNKRVPIDPGIVSIPILQEYVCQPQVSEIPGNKFIYKTMGGTVERDREPVLALENLDYVVDDETTVRGICNVNAGDDIVEMPFGDLFDRSVHTGDRLDIEIFGRFETFTISQVLDPEHVRVIPAPAVTDTQLVCRLIRRVGGKFVRFVGHFFDPKKRAPLRLWAEVTYFDNNPTIEDNFGILVGITQDDIEKANATVPYRSAVAGLMYALTTGSTISNIRLAAQILLGLPFTENAGVITEINPDYRLADDGSSLLGRILIEARDKDDLPIGVTNIYLYPRGRQLADPDNPGQFIDAVPEFQGVAINPATGTEYVVGDHVDQFVPLTKGINIQEYISQPTWFAGLVGRANAGLPLEIYHSFNVIINSDLVTTSDIDIAAAFIKRAKPTYTKLKSVLLKEVEDLVQVDDNIQFKIVGQTFDQVSGSLSSAVKFDGGDLNATFIQLPGLMYQRLIANDDLQTSSVSSVVTSPSGGFINPRPLFSESHDSPFVRVGDVLVIPGGSNAGQWGIIDVPSDDSVQLELLGAVFEDIAPDPDPLVAPRQAFTIYRPIQNPIWYGDADVTQNDDTVGIPSGGLFSAGITVGDILVFQTSDTTWSRQYIITEADAAGPGLKLLTAVLEATGTYPAAVVREPLTKQFFGVGESAPFPAAGTQANVTSGSSLISFNAVAAGLILAQVNPGDVVSDGARNFTVLRNEPSASGLRVSPTPNFTDANLTVSISRPTRGNSTITVDILDRLPSDYLQLDLALSTSNTTDKLVTTNGSNQVNTQLSINLTDLGLRVGDFIVILEGADASVDDGHGPGVFMVFSFVSNTQARLSRNMSSSGNRRYAIRKRKPNVEG